MNLLLRLYLVIRRSGWFVPGMTGGLFPFPVAWQAWALLAGLIVAITATVGLPDVAVRRLYRYWYAELRRPVIAGTAPSG